MTRLLVTCAVLLAGCSGGYRLPAAAGAQSLDAVAEGQGLDRTRLRSNVCAGINMTPKDDTLDERSLADFLEANGYRVRVAHARTDLAYVEVWTSSTASDAVRLRVALLPSQAQAGEELHRALLQHGTGSWGVHRSNLAVLAPPGDVERILRFAAKTRLACWGVLTVAGRDDAYVVPGGYREL